LIRIQINVCSVTYLWSGEFFCITCVCPPVVSCHSCRFFHVLIYCKTAQPNVIKLCIDEPC